MSALPVPRVEVHDSADELATAVAGALIRLLTVKQAAGDVPLVVLTGGTIADLIHREVARLGPGSEVDWAKVDFYWGDERFVAPDSDDRNAKQARQAFLDAIGVDPARVHEIPSTSEADSVDDAATSYSATVRASEGSLFDLLMLGVGPDGHIASLFPGFPQLTADAIAVGVTGSPKPPPERVTLTLEALNHSEEVWFVVSGAEKAEAVGRALAAVPPSVHEIPATGVHGRVSTTWFLDRDAASQVG